MGGQNLRGSDSLFTRDRLGPGLQKLLCGIWLLVWPRFIWGLISFGPLITLEGEDLPGFGWKQVPITWRVGQAA